MTKTCPRCGETKQIEEFNKSQAYCRTCQSAAHRAWRLAKIYGMDEKRLAELLEAQLGSCDICGKPLELAGMTTDGLRIDHDHKTGHVRGLLCNDCNTGLGLFGDDPMRLRAAVQYLLERTP